MAARNNDLAKIHIAKSQLGIDDDSYRDILWSVGRVKSAKDLDAHGRAAVLRYLKRIGFKPKKTGRAHAGAPNNLKRDDRLRKIEAQLADMGLPWSYVHGIMQQMGMRQARLEFLSDQQKISIITALSKRQQKLAEQERLGHGGDAA